MRVEKEIVDIEEHVVRVIREVRNKEYVSRDADSFLTDLEAKVKLLRGLVDSKKV